MKHGRSEKRETAREQRAQERIRGDSASCRALEGIDKVVESGLEDGEESEAHHHGAENRSDPVDVFRARPAEHEHACGEEDGAQHHGRESCFGHGAVVVRFEAADVVTLVAEVDGRADEDAD